MELLVGLRPQSKAFLSWMRQAVKQQEPVAFGVFVQTETMRASTTGLSSIRRDGGTLVFNDLHSRSHCARSCPALWNTRVPKGLAWSERLPLPAERRQLWYSCTATRIARAPCIQLADHGRVDGARLLSEDSKGESPKLLGARCTQGPDTGSEVSVLVFDDWTRVPKKPSPAIRRGSSWVDFI